MRGLERRAAGKEPGWRDGPDRGCSTRPGREGLVWPETSVSRRRTTAGRAARCGRGPADPPSASPTASARRHPAAVFFAALFCGVRGRWPAVARRSGCSSRDVLARTSGGLGVAPTTARSRRSSAERSRSLTRCPRSAPTVGGAPVLPILVGLVAIVCAFHAPLAHRRASPSSCSSSSRRPTASRRWSSRASARTCTRLEDLPANASYPSGHTAASIAVYAGLVLLLTSAIGNRSAAHRRLGRRRSCCPSFVAMSRMYRGMHHPLDVAGGVAHRHRRDAGAAVRLPRGGRRAALRPPRAAHASAVASRRTACRPRR